MTLTPRGRVALRALREAGHLERQEDGYWDTELHARRRAFGERTILDLIRENHAKVTATSITRGRRGLPTKIEPTGDNE